LCRHAAGVAAQVRHRVCVRRVVVPLRHTDFDCQKRASAKTVEARYVLNAAV
jgi:hypothetical protein